MRRVVRALTCFGALLAFSFLALPVIVYSNQHSACVRLPNGVIIAYEAKMNLRHAHLKPSFVVKGPTGDVFSVGNDRSLNFSETTAYWIDDDSMSVSGKGELAYREDTGLVARSENPLLYNKLIAETGALLANELRWSNTDIYSAFHLLGKHNHFRSKDCGVPLFVFRGTDPNLYKEWALLDYFFLFHFYSVSSVIGLYGFLLSF